jgi:hypothetical protein
MLFILIITETETLQTVESWLGQKQDLQPVRLQDLSQFRQQQRQELQE